MTENQGKPLMIKRMRWIARAWSLLLLVLALAITFAPPVDETLEPPDPLVAVEPVPTIEYIALGAYGLAVFGLLLAWLWELPGGMVAIIAVLSHDMLFYVAKGFLPQYLAGNLIVGLVFILPAALFILCWWQTRRKPAAQPVLPV
jgi:hypothetical protein